MHKNRDTGAWEHDFRVKGIDRYRMGYGRIKKADAEKLHAVASALFRAKAVEVIDAIRAGGVSIEQVAQAYALGLPFQSVLTDARNHTPWPTYADAAAQYVAGVARNPNKAAKTAQIVKEQLARGTPFFGADTRIDTITSARVTEYQAWLMDAKLAVNTVTQYVARIGAMFRWHIRREAVAAREGNRAPRVLYVPIDSETISTAKTRRERFLTEGEAEALLAATPAPLLFPVAAGLFGGFRVSEMLHLRPAFDVDLTTGVLMVQAQPDWKPKTAGSVRHVPISSALRPILTHHLARYASEDWVTPAFSDPTRPMSRGVLDIHFAKIVGNAELVSGRKDPQGITYHTLRHTFASWLLMKGSDVFTVAKLLGNSVKQVEDTYGHLSKDHRLAAVNRLAGSITLPALSDGEA